MDTVLLVLGILGFGAIVVAAYVFTVAARNYVSDHNDAVKTAEAASPDRVFIERNRRARRQEVQVVFPITVNGAVIPQDRRKTPDRRLIAA